MDINLLRKSCEEYANRGSALIFDEMVLAYELVQELKKKPQGLSHESEQAYERWLEARLGRERELYKKKSLPMPRSLIKFFER